MTVVELAAAEAATSEVLEPDSGLKIAGQVAVDWGSAAPERAATVLWKKFWNLQVKFVMTAILFRHCRKQVQDAHLRLAAWQARPSLEAKGFEQHVDCRVQSQQGTTEVLGQLDGRGSTTPLLLSH
jgi:hypothetical protein